MRRAVHTPGIIHAGTHTGNSSTDAMEQAGSLRRRACAILLRRLEGRTR